MSFARYPKYKDSGVEWLGEVPEHWRVSRLKRVCDVYPSNIDKKSYEGEESVFLCNYTDVYYNDQIVQDMDFMVATASCDQIIKFTLRSGDTIITKDSETADDIAIAAYIPKNLPGVVCGYHLSVVRPRADVFGAYVKRLFDSHYVRAKFRVSANGLTRVGLSQYAVDNIILPWPPNEEQSIIATFLDRETAKIDALVAEQEKLIALLKEKRQAVISHAVTKGLDPTVPMKDSGVEWLGEVPKHWRIISIKWLSPVQRGASPRPIDDPKYFDDEGEYAWVRIADVSASDGNLRESTQYLSELGSTLSVKIEPGELFVSIAGTVGKPCISEIKACIHDGFVYFPSLKITPKFLYRIFEAATCYGGLGKWGTQLNLNTDTIGSIRIALPPPPELGDILTFLDRETACIDALTAEAEKGISLLKERRNALISVAVTGKIRIA